MSLRLSAGMSFLEWIWVCLCLQPHRGDLGLPVNFPFHVWLPIAFYTPDVQEAACTLSQKMHRIPPASHSTWIDFQLFSGWHLHTRQHYIVHDAVDMWLRPCILSWDIIANDVGQVILLNVRLRPAWKGYCFWSWCWHSSLGRGQQSSCVAIRVLVLVHPHFHFMCCFHTLGLAWCLCPLKAPLEVFLASSEVSP